MTESMLRKWKKEIQNRGIEVCFVFFFFVPKWTKISKKMEKRNLPLPPIGGIDFFEKIFPFPKSTGKPKNEKQNRLHVEEGVVVRTSPPHPPLLRKRPFPWVATLGERATFCFVLFPCLPPRPKN